MTIEAQPMSTDRISLTGSGGFAWLPWVVGIACLVPLFLTPVLPLTDFYAHIARYFILVEAGSDPVIGASYEPAWSLLPNLGLDIFGAALISVLPPLVTAKVIGAMVILSPFLGVVLLSRVLHGQVQPIAVFIGGILVFSQILVWGFANFLIGLGLVLMGIALWISTRDRPGLQMATSAVFGVLLLFVHGLAFALWGLMLGCIELMDWKPRREGVMRLVLRMLRLAALAVVPVFLFTRMNTAGSDDGITAAFANLAAHAEQGQMMIRILDEIWQRIDGMLRVADSQIRPIDWISGLAMWGVLGLAVKSGVLRVHRAMWLAIALAALLVPFIPPNFFGVGHVDERAPLLLLALIGAAASLSPVAAPRAARLTLGFFAGLCILRLGLVSWGWQLDGRQYALFLDAIRGQDTGELGVPLFIADVSDRPLPTGRVNCKPYLFLLTLENRTVTATFANPTEQPLRLTGPLLAAYQSMAQMRPDDDSTVYAPPTEVVQHLQVMAAAGFDTIVACSAGPMAPPPAGFATLGTGRGWAIYAPRP
jgi:hypothetical protein